MKFKDKLAFYMHHLKITEEELSRDFHVSISSIRHWLSGFSEPHPAMAKIILTVLEEEYEDVIN